MSMSKISYFFEKTCLTCVVAIVSFLAVGVLIWMFYILSGLEL